MQPWDRKNIEILVLDVFSDENKVDDRHKGSTPIVMRWPWLVQINVL